jgi:hypothetical protein
MTPQEAAAARIAARASMSMTDLAAKMKVELPADACAIVSDDDRSLVLRNTTVYGPVGGACDGPQEPGV